MTAHALERGDGLRWVLAGGGTGGHVTPALAIGQRLRERGEPLLFIGTRRGMETRLVPEAGFELVALGSRPLVGQGCFGRLRALAALALATLAARRRLRAFAADVVVSVGGYAAVPVLLAARLARIPIVLMEPNAIPGFAHRVTARFAGRICVAFPSAAAALGRGPQDPRLRQTGIPLRQELVAALGQRNPPRAPRPPFHLFVFGGSQGAQQINDWMLEALRHLDLGRLEVVHQTGERDRERVARAYAEAGLRAEVVAFERDMASRYRWADLVICRAGAISVAELALAGRPAILVPLAHVGGGEQAANALALEEPGAARVIDPRTGSGKELADTLEALLSDPEQLARMGERSAQLGRPDAAERVIAEARALVAEQRNARKPAAGAQRGGKPEGRAASRRRAEFSGPERSSPERERP